MFRLGLIFSWDQDQTCHVQLNSPGPKYWQKKKKEKYKRWNKSIKYKNLLIILYYVLNKTIFIKNYFALGQFY